mmetsp:Transcript_37299/g.81236  ORF Transcript_37299/g.81236 Transcript_37299/m.81236 type:complete len:260 (+) Transcript_37299:215-994(+)
MYSAIIVRVGGDLPFGRGVRCSSASLAAPKANEARARRPPPDAHPCVVCAVSPSAPNSLATSSQMEAARSWKAASTRAKPLTMPERSVCRSTCSRSHSSALRPRMRPYSAMEARADASHASSSFWRSSTFFWCCLSPPNTRVLASSSLARRARLCLASASSVCAVSSACVRSLSARRTAAFSPRYWCSGPSCCTVCAPAARASRASRTHARPLRRTSSAIPHSVAPSSVYCPRRAPSLSWWLASLISAMPISPSTSPCA